MNEAATSFCTNIRSILEDPDTCELRGVGYDPLDGRFWIEYIQKFDVDKKILYRDYFKGEPAEFRTIQFAVS